MHRVLATLGAAAAMLLSAAAPLWSQQHGADRIAVLVRAGDDDGARAVIRRIMRGKPDAALHVAHLEGVIRMRDKDYKEAIRIFRLILSVEPNFTPARFELARALLRTGDRDGSSYHFQALARGSDDAPVRHLAERYLDRIDGSRDYGFSYYFSLLPSTNVNKGTHNRTFEAGGLVFAIDEDSRKASGVGAGTGGSAFRTFRLDESYAVVASGWADIRKYSETTESDEIGVGGSVALSRRAGRLSWAAGPAVEYRWAAGDPYLLRYGITAGVRAVVGERNTVSFSLSSRVQDYVDQDYRDGHIHIAGLSVRRALSQSDALAARLGLTFERTQRRHLDYDGASLGLEYDKEWRGGFMTSFFGSFEWRDYLGNFPATDHRREDRLFSIGAGVSHRKLNFAGFTPKATYKFTDRKSNVSFYEYESHDFGLALTREF
ncbi:surface lipoprotein assembly modifier [Chelativorans sp. AA-79]|uniref:surface lipoprotein assembly modifier n=1 Tax=Chelativorans sp. AA-79 TaxID=3028735 RepID=UPI0023F8359A|nr:surface lipoprotein assembly modifier [Chelativorans sp. AA-79]WEX07524.1 surface lipoprotein assembly modifier [Chelativorans sp. AA-79]